MEEKFCFMFKYEVGKENEENIVLFMRYCVSFL